MRVNIDHTHQDYQPMDTKYVWSFLEDVVNPDM